MSRILDEMAETKYRIDEITRGYESGEYSHWKRDNSGLRLTDLRLTDSECDAIESGLRHDVQDCAPCINKIRPEIVYAERNSELHVLCHEMLCALEAAGVDMDTIHAFRERLHNVPQCRR